MSTLGVGVIGVGFAAGMHVAALRRLPGVDLVGVVDIDRQRARTAAERLGGIAWTTRLEEALAWPGLDACVVCTPNDTHAHIGEAVAAAGKHLLMEKPLALTEEDAAGLVTRFAQRGLVLMAGHTHRFTDYGRALRAAIAGGDVREPVLVRVAALGGWIWPDWRSWIIDPARSGGHVLHNGVHLLDLVTWWIGREPRWVYAQGRRQTSADLDIHDYLSLMVHYDGGCTALCEISRANVPRTFAHRDVLVQGTAGSLELPWDAAHGVAFGDARAGAFGDQGQLGFDREVAAWVDAIRSGADPPVSGREAVRAVALAVAGEHSLRSGRVEPVGRR